MRDAQYEMSCFRPYRTKRTDYVGIKVSNVKLGDPCSETQGIRFPLHFIKDSRQCESMNDRTAMKRKENRYDTSNAMTLFS